MTDIGRVLRLEARSTALFLAVPVLAAIGLAAAWPVLIPGVGYWDNTAAAVIGSVRALGPACAALAAWTALRDDPTLGYLRGLTVRSPATVPLLDLSLLAGVTLPAYGIVIVVVSVKTAMHEEAGRLSPLGLALGASVLLMMVAAGYLAGRLFSHLITVPFVAVAAYAWAVVSPDGITSWSGLPTPAAIDRVNVFVTVDDGLFLARLMWSLGLCVLLVAGPLMWLTRRLWLVVPLGLALGAAAAGIARVHTYDEPVTAARFDYVCRNWPLRVCVHPALRPALRTLGTAVTPLAARLAGTPAEFTTVIQRPAGTPLGFAPSPAAPGSGHTGPPGTPEGPDATEDPGLRGPGNRGQGVPEPRGPRGAGRHGRPGAHGPAHGAAPGPVAGQPAPSDSRGGPTPHRAYGAPGARVVAVRIDDLSPGFERRVLQQIVTALLDPYACGRAQSESTGAYTALVSAWLLDQRPPPVPDPTAAALFARQDEAGRRAWLRAHYPRYRTCRLTAQDFHVMGAAAVQQRLFAAAEPRHRGAPRAERPEAPFPSRARF